MKRLKLLTMAVCAAVVALVVGTAAFAADGITDQKGNLTIQNAISGKTYDVYRVFDLTNDGDGHYAYTVNSDFSGYFTAKSISDPVAYVDAMATDSTELSNLAKDLLAYAIDKNVAVAGSVTATGSTATISDLAYGYYLLNPLGGLQSKDTAKYATMFALNTLSGQDTVIDVKAVYPTVIKKIVVGTTEADANAASIGDTVSYKISSTVPDMTGYTGYWYNLDDMLDPGLTLDKSSFKITIDGTELAASDYTVYSKASLTDGTRIWIVFDNFIQYKAEVGADIIVTYNATLNEDAKIYDSTATAKENGNANVVYGLYSNDPKLTYTGNTPVDPGTDPDNPNFPEWHTPQTTGVTYGVTPEVEVATYTAKVNIYKYNGNTGEDPTALTGAKFSIAGTSLKAAIINDWMFASSDTGAYYMLKDGTYTTTAPTEDTAYLYDSTTAKYKKVWTDDTDLDYSKVVKEGYVTAATPTGYVTFTGLGAGDYTVTELVAPQGFNLLQDPIAVKVTFDANTKTFTVTADGQPTATEDATSILKDGSSTVKVANTSGNVMPSTGGLGTVLLYAAGAALLVGGAIALIVRRRMSL